MADKAKRSAPSDEKCMKAWEQIMEKATEHCLIVGSYGGTATLALPEEQRNAGIREKVLTAHYRKENAGE